MTLPVAVGAVTLGLFTDNDPESPVTAVAVTGVVYLLAAVALAAAAGREALTWTSANPALVVAATLLMALAAVAAIRARWTATGS